VGGDINIAVALLPVVHGIASLQGAPGNPSAYPVDDSNYTTANAVCLCIADNIGGIFDRKTKICYTEFVSHFERASGAEEMEIWENTLS
jgi:hypothetical protein